MRTSEELYHKVRWDPRFDPARFVLGIEQRGRAPKRVLLPSFTPGGEIPWHRILFVEADGEVVWDRAAGIDRLDSADSGRAESPRVLAAPFFEPRTPHAWDPVDVAWRPALNDELRLPSKPGRQSAATPDRIRILSWNTLWDRYDPELVQTSRRRPMLLNALRAADVDVIVLQEVERDLLRLLMQSSWVRDSYTLSCDPKSGDVEFCGVVVLSRLPVREAGWHELKRNKALVAIALDCGGAAGAPDSSDASGVVTVIGVHLSSDHSDDAVARRAAELAQLNAGISAIDGTVIVAGDFNDATEGAGDPADVLGMADVAASLGPTFVPAANPLAAIGSRTGNAGRLDRILLRAANQDALVAGSMSTLLGTDPNADGLHASDHYGVFASLPLRRPQQDTRMLALLEPDAQIDALAADVTSRMAEALGDGRVHVVGSRAMGIALRGADLDLVAEVCDGTDARDIRTRVAAAFPEAEWHRVVEGTRTTGVRVRLPGLSVDLTIADKTSPTFGYAWSAVGDARAVLAAVDTNREQFRTLARTVKLWAKARGLDAAPFGTLPGLAWAVMAAAATSVAAASPAEPGHSAGDLLLTRFFEQWAEWDWRQPILTPSDPVRSMTEQVSANSRDLIATELLRGWEIVTATTPSGSDPLPALCAPPDLASEHRAWLLVTVRPGATEVFDEAVGRVRGRMRSLMSELEQAGVAQVRVWPRSVPTEGEGAAYAIGLGRTPPASGPEVEQIAREWARGAGLAHVIEVTVTDRSPIG